MHSKDGQLEELMRKMQKQEIQASMGLRPHTTNPLQAPRFMPQHFMHKVLQQVPKKAIPPTPTRTKVFATGAPYPTDNVQPIPKMQATEHAPAPPPPAKPVVGFKYEPETGKRTPIKEPPARRPGEAPSPTSKAPAIAASRSRSLSTGFASDPLSPTERKREVERDLPPPARRREKAEPSGPRADSLPGTRLLEKASAQERPRSRWLRSQSR